MKRRYTNNVFVNEARKEANKSKKSRLASISIKNIFNIPKFIMSNNVNLLSKIKVIFFMIVGFLYFISPIDIIPEILVGPFGLVDDAFILIWILGFISDEIQLTNNKLNKDIITDVDYTIKK